MFLKSLRTRSCTWDSGWISRSGVRNLCARVSESSLPDWRWADTTLTPLSTAQGLRTAASFGQQHVSLSLGRPGREDDSEGRLNHRGFPWARLDLGRSPAACLGRGDGWGRNFWLYRPAAPGAISLLKDFIPVVLPQVRNGIEVTHGMCKSHS